MAGASSTLVGDLGRFLRASWINVLLVFIPVSLALEFTHAPPVWIFAASGLAIVPLAGLIGQATEAATEHTGPGLGGFLNATFGNATELIIALLAVRQGLYGVVKASITGSILGNMLLVLGLAMIVGGWGRDRQRFNRTAAGASATMLMLAVTALVMPATWDLVVFGSLGDPNPTVTTLSVLTAGVLIVTYIASLVFSLITHRRLFTASEHGTPVVAHYGLTSAVMLLVIATAVTALEAEILHRRHASLLTVRR